MKKILITLSITIFFSFKALAVEISSQGNFLNLSDVHFDPFYDITLVDELVTADYMQWESIFAGSKVQSFGSYGKDSDYKLLISALEDMKFRIPNPDFVIITGDFMAHSFNENFYKYSGLQDDDALHDFIHKTMKFVTSVINKYYPTTTIFPMLGNDDSDCDNYMVQPNGEFLRILSEIWYPLSVRKGVDANYVKTFAKGGYCIVNFPGTTKYKMIILNSIFFSPYYEDSCGNPYAKPGDEELTWLQTTLKQCKSKKQKVWLAYHIPPGIDIYGTITDTNTQCEKKIIKSWAVNYNDKFLSIVRDYSSTIIANFAGHFHRDDFRIIYKNKVPVSYIHLTPSISPVYYNNPAYQIFIYDKSNYKLMNYETYYLNLNNKENPAWSFEYDFKSAYNQSIITSSTLNYAYQLIKSDTTYRKNYIKFYTASNVKSFDSDYKNWYYNWCGIGKLTASSYADCNCKK